MLVPKLADFSPVLLLIPEWYFCFSPLHFVYFDGTGSISKCLYSFPWHTISFPSMGGKPMPYKKICANHILQCSKCPCMMFGTDESDSVYLRDAPSLLKCPESQKRWELERHIKYVKSNNIYFCILCLWFILRNARKASRNLTFILKQSLILSIDCVIIVARPTGDLYKDLIRFNNKKQSLMLYDTLTSSHNL